MGWLSNRARRGLTNRSYSQICREVGSAGAGAAQFAVAMAAAVYPDSKYGLAEWDQLNAAIPPPIVDSTTAGKIVEAWLDYHQLDWSSCISRLYGRDPTELLEKSAGTSSPESRVSPSQMKTEAGKKIAGDVNRSLETSETQQHRLKQVLDEFLFYTRDFQLDLAEAAIIWQLAAIASHGRRNECKSNLYAICDLMYVSTRDAEQSLSESERQQIVVAATAVQQYLVPRVGEVLQAATQKLASFEKDGILRILAEMLHRVRGQFLEHAPPRLLSDLIGHVFITCGAIDAYEFGGCSQEEVARAMQHVANCCSELSNAVIAKVEAGKLLVQDGRIVDPKSENRGT